ncbi:four-carbon acid sugar kinase family protein [Halomonas alkalisoli]|uniref:four-carbon acid sugar kinase family protein n=1 Tax=Halomonas alkalisoli TaxID=2907158 RepID=UPI001F2A54EA|nr:four-carbon acid sugar kinase family protein [Halomonas alkalisoli]MCE9683462.1 hypothetical protein [Halomonas alkalisoli]
MTRLLAAFYGDDFTGSAENLAQFHRHGLRCRLYFSVDGLVDIADTMANGLDVVGIAGTARALSPDDMTEEVEPAFALMQRLDPLVLQYKICSTFDSSPRVGSLGRIMELARRQWPGCSLPVFPATPAFGRYTAFATHFTRVNGDICRLDRNPAMANHPSTPMHESDLRRHLAEQTDLQAGAVMLTDYQAGDGGRKRLQDELDRGGFAILDAVDDSQVLHVARLVASLSQTRPSVAIAAQGLADGLGRLWAETNKDRSADSVQDSFPGVDRLLVLSGSCAPQTQGQLNAMAAAGATIIRLVPEAAVADPELAAEEILDGVRSALTEGRDVAVATTRRSEEITASLDGDGLARAIGVVFARVARAARVELGLQRIVFAGGDTSSYSMRQIGADALEIAVFDQQRSGHICRLISSDPALDGLEVVLKGGQVAGDDFFLRAKAGTRG